MHINRDNDNLLGSHDNELLVNNIVIIAFIHPGTQVSLEMHFLSRVYLYI